MGWLACPGVGTCCGGRSRYVLGMHGRTHCHHVLGPSGITDAWLISV